MEGGQSGGAGEGGGVEVVTVAGGMGQRGRLWGVERGGMWALGRTVAGAKVHSLVGLGAGSGAWS